jgi:hypothetical protein
MLTLRPKGLRAGSNPFAEPFLSSPEFQRLLATNGESGAFRAALGLAQNGAARIRLW